MQRGENKGWKGTHGLLIRIDGALIRSLQYQCIQGENCSNRKVQVAVVIPGIVTPRLEYWQ